MPAADSLAKAIRPKSNVYTVMIVLSFGFFVGAFVLTWVWLAKSYDSGFPGIHGIKLSDESAHRSETIERQWAEMTGRAYDPQYVAKDDPQFDLYEEDGLPDPDPDIQKTYGIPKLDDKYLPKAYILEDIIGVPPEQKGMFDPVRTHEEMQKIIATPEGEAESAPDEAEPAAGQ